MLKPNASSELNIRELAQAVGNLKKVKSGCVPDAIEAWMANEQARKHLRAGEYAEAIKSAGMSEMGVSEAVGGKEQVKFIEIAINTVLASIDPTSD
eukprot:2860966-Alexandrium_andersonii.AAC.1